VERTSFRAGVAPAGVKLSGFHGARAIAILSPIKSS
jgi:hypothetical protein